MSKSKTKASSKARKPVAKSNPSSRFSKYLSLERVIIGGTILFVIGLIGVIAWNSWSNRPIDIKGIQEFPSVTAGHQETAVNYEESPPVGGPHYPVWQNCGAYDQPIRNEMAVHSMEHGAVWITYRPDLSIEEVEQLRNLVRPNSYRLLSPYPDLPSPIAVSSWGYQLQIESVDDERLSQFIRQYEQGPNTPELGATCSGGIDRPLAQLP
mgnify:CR=1 FL=1